MKPSFFLISVRLILFCQSLYSQVNQKDRVIILTDIGADTEDSSKYGYGSPHGQDVAYVFKHLNSSDPQISKANYNISQALTTSWINFAKYDDPNSQGFPNWSAFGDENPIVMYFGKTPHTVPVPGAESLKVLDEYFRWRWTPEGKSWVK